MSTTRELTVMGYPVEDQQPSSSISLQPPGAAKQISTRIPIQLTKENYLLWKSLFISVLRASPDMLDLAEGREQCPPRFLTEEKERENSSYTDWIRRDQTLLTWINSGLSLSLLGRTKEFTSGRALWLHLEKLLAENAMTRVRELRDRLRNLNMKEFTTTKEYLETAKQVADGLEAAGSPVHDSEYVSCVLNGLPDSYNGFVSSIRDQPEPVTREQLQKSLEGHIPGSGRIAAIILFLLFLPALFLCLVRKISFIIPLVLFVVLVAALIRHILLSLSYTRRSADSMYMELHTECV